MIKRLTLTCLLTLCITVISMAVTKSQVVVYINGERYYIHTVESKETIYSIAKAYGVTEQIVIDLNSNELKEGEKIKIPFSSNSTSAKKRLSGWETLITFSKHKVERGQTLYSISKLYGISIDTIIKDNPTIDPTSLPEGYKLLIRKKKKGTSSVEDIDEQWSDYKSDLNSVIESEEYKYHIVERGETIYSLAKKSGLSEKEFIELNNLEGGLKAGAMIKIPNDTTSKKVEAVTEDTENDVNQEIEEQPLEQINLRSLRHGQKLKIALLLPLSNGDKVNRQFADFYKGFEAGLDSVKTKWGRDIELNLYNTERSIEAINEIIRSDDFQETNLIVGPIYEDLMGPVIEYAERTQTPIVSPLATLKEVKSSVVFQLAPPSMSKFEKVEPMLDNTKHVTLIYTEKTDTLFEQNIMSIIGERPYDKHKYRYEHPTIVAEKMANNRESAGDLSKFINNGKDNTIIVMSSSETDVDRILSALSSAQINIVARGGKAPKYEVLGNSEWSKFKNIDRTILFKNNVVLLSSYLAKRNNHNVLQFDSAYIKQYGALPSLYTYRGYDAAMVFGEGIYSDMDYNLEGRTFTPLQSHYRFKTDPTTGIHINTEWIRANYRNDYIITIE